MDKLRFFPHNPKEIHDDVIASLEEHLHEPLYPGDERTLFAEAFVAILMQAFALADDKARQYMLRYARGEVLDALGERVDVLRESGQPASVRLSFAVGNPIKSNILIPLGTRVTSDGQKYFKTTEIAVIEAGDVTTEVLGESMGVGTPYNDLPLGSISSLVDAIPMVGSVVNITVSQGGDDGEPYTEEGDDHYRERIRAASAKLSTAGPYNAYKYFAKTAHTGITDVAVWSPTPGTVSIAPLMEGGVLPSKEVLYAVDTSCNASDVRPLTDLVKVLSPEIIPYDIEFVYYVRKGEEAEVVQNVEGKGGSIQKYIQWQGAVLGRDINPDQLRKNVLLPHWEENLKGALRLDVKFPVFRELIGEEEADFLKSQNVELAKWSGELLVSHKVVNE